MTVPGVGPAGDYGRGHGVDEMETTWDLVEAGNFHLCYLRYPIKELISAPSLRAGKPGSGSTWWRRDKSLSSRLKACA